MPSFKQTLIPLALATTLVNATWPNQSFKTVPFNPPVFNITKSGAPLAEGLLFLTPVGNTESLATIMTDSGDLVWSAPTGDYSNLFVQTLDDKPVMHYWNGSGSANVAVAGHGYGAVSILDTSYTTLYDICADLNIRTVNNTVYECQADLHEQFLTDRGTLIVSGYNVTQTDLTAVGGAADGYVSDSMFFEIDIKTQKVLFSWSALAHVPITDSQLPLYSPTMNVTMGTATEPWDFFHVNSIESVGDKYLVNGRHVWTSYLVNSTGAIEWRIEGATGGDFKLPYDNLFKWEHHVRAHNVTDKSLTLSIFNNNNTIPASTTNQTSGLYLDLDLTTKFATLKKQLIDPAQPLFVSTQGANSPLSNGNYFLGYGQLPYMKEFTPTGDVAMTITFGDVADNSESYRAYRIKWEAMPAADPVAVVESGKVYMSWNGATNVTQWKIYEGSCEDELVLRSKIANSGFESSNGIWNSTAYVKVAAFNGEVFLRNSSVVAVN